MPCVAVGAVLVGVMLGVLVARGPTPGRRLGVALGVLLLILSGVRTAQVFWGENVGAPARALVGGAEAISGAALGPLDEIAKMPPAELLELLRQAGNPVAATNIVVALDAPDGAVALLGDATPVYFGVPAAWNTVWDRWPLEAARAAAPDDPASWCAALRAESPRVTHVLVNFAEIERFTRSGYAPPGMTVETARRFVEACGELVIEWPRRGVGLYRLRRSTALLMRPNNEPTASSSGLSDLFAGVNKRHPLAYARGSFFGRVSGMAIVFIRRSAAPERTDDVLIFE